MSNSKASLNLEHDCTVSCKSVNHGLQITQALTKRSVTDEQLAAYINWICASCGEVCDKEGRTALHLAASCGRLKLARYLIHMHGASINFPDIESGCTALHRAVFYGQLHVAVHLMKMGAELGILDNGSLSAIDYAMRDRYPSYDFKKVNSGEIYVWGSNENYTLGIGNQQSRNYPDLLEVFRRENIFIKQVSLHKFHTLFLTTSGQVYSCGHGQGGRLGNGSENTVLTPQLIKFVAHGLAQEPCVHISAGRDHSLFVMESGIVWSCGLNTYSQLGLQDAPKFVVTPRPLKSKLSSVQYVCAARFHSIAWGPKGVFTWGLNSGQLGHDGTSGEFINAPKKVMGLGNSEITSVASSDGATVITTSSGHIYVLHEFQCRKIGSKRHNIASVSVIGGHLSPSNALSHVLKERGGDNLKILVLTTDGLLYIWTEQSLQLIRCIFSLKRPLSIRAVALNLHNVFLITDHGEAFKGEFKAIKIKKDSTSGEQQTSAHQPSPFTSFLNRHECAMIKVTRIPNIYRAVAVACDSRGRNCAVIQANPSFEATYLPRVSPSIMSQQMLDLLENATLEDSLHDIEFKVGLVTIPAHKFIVFKSEQIKQLHDSQCSKTEPIEIDNVNLDVFKQLLKYLYTGTCDLLQAGVCPIPFIENENSSPDDSRPPSSPEFSYEESKTISAFEVYRKQKKKTKGVNKSENEEDIAKKDPVRQLQHCAKRFGLSDLYSDLDKFRYENGFINDTGKNKTLSSKKCLSRLSHSDLLDTKIASGTNANIIKAHRCILVARLEYFYGMFMHSWRENKSDTMVSLPYPHRVLEVIVNFLYTDDWSEKDTCDDIDFICQLMIVADQLFMVRLREMCEVVLAHHITLKNVATFLQFSTVYNATQLHECCVRYICLNLASLLENRYLEILPDEILSELAQKYISYNKYMSTRVITPYSTAPSDEEIIDIYQKFAVNVEELCEGNKKKQTPKKKVLPRRISESDKSRSRNESICESPKSNSISLDVNLACNVTLNESPKLVDIQNCKNFQKEMTVVQKRLSAIAAVRDVEIKEQFEKLVKPDIINNMEKKSPEFHKKVMKTKTDENIANKSPSETFNISTFIEKSPYPKLSQKQRKKLFAQSVANDLEKINAKEKPKTPVSPWDMQKTTCNDSFADILKNKERVSLENDNHQNLLSESPKNNPKGILAQLNNLNINSPCVSTKDSPIFIKEEQVTFSDILADERQQKENYSKMKSKPLVLTQIEDRAIEDLEKFYNIDGVEDEMITIARVCKVKYASPLWIQK